MVTTRARAAVLAILLSAGAGATLFVNWGLPATGAISASMANQTTGVAPLTVFFSVVDAPEIDQQDAGGGRIQYEDDSYIWNFGDPNGGNWSTDGTPRNVAYGYLAYHLYETPGVYNVQLQRKTGDVTQEYTTSITVTDPAVVYAGTATTCVSSSGTFAGCPSGANQVTTSDLTGFGAYLQAGERLLLARGDSWASNDGVTITTTGPTTLGAYGTCVDADTRGICANAPVLNATGTGTNALLGMVNVTNLRIQDVSLVGTDTRQGISGDTELHRIVITRVKTRGFDTPVGNSHWYTEDHNHWALVENDIQYANKTVVFIGANRLAIAGNDIANSDTTHVLRIWQAYQGCVEHNRLSGSSLENENGRLAMKLHGPAEELIESQAEDHLDNRTRYVVISDNVFGSSGPWPVSIGPQDSLREENLEDILVERNRWLPAYGLSSPILVTIGLHVYARNVTIRNNVFSGEGAGGAFVAVEVNRSGIAYLPTNVRIYNNTIYEPNPGQYQNINGWFQVLENTENITIQNNLVEVTGSFPMVYNEGPSTTADHNVSLEDADFVDAVNENQLAKNFALMGTSAARNVGTQVPVFDDYAHILRPKEAVWDVGAHEYVP